MFGDLLQCMDILIIDTAEKASVKSLDNHYFCAFAVMYLFPSGVQHPVMAVPELDRMPAIHGPFCQDSENQVDFFIFRLRFKHRFDTIKGKRELLIEFFYV